MALELSLACLTITQLSLMASFFGGMCKAAIFHGCTRGYTHISSQATKHSKISLYWASIFPQNSLKNFGPKLRLFRTKQAQYTYSPSSLLPQLLYKKKRYQQGLKLLQGKRNLTVYPMACLPKHTALQDERELETPMSPEG